MSASRGVQPSVRDVVADAAVEQPGVLEDHAEARPQLVPGELADIVAIERDATRVHVVEAHQQIDQRGLAGPGRAHDGDRRARLRRQGQVRDERLSA